jgi:inner membrane protein
LTSARERSHVPVDLPVGDHAAFLWMAVATHALVGYTLGKVLLDESAWGLLGGVAADVDLLFPLAWQPPLVHRGITHTALAAVLLAVLAARWRRSAGLAVGTAYASHLAIDATTPAGVALFYPLSTVRVDLALGGHSGTATVLLWIACLTALYWHRR